MNEDAVCLDPKARQNINSLCLNPHLLILDLNVFLTQMDVIEDQAFGDNVVVLQTVRNEVRYKNLSIYSRIKNIPKHRKFFFFINEFNMYTFKPRRRGETSEDYILNLTLEATKWYQNHVKKTLQVILLVHDPKSKLKAQEAGLLCYTIEEYAQNLKGNSIIDKVFKWEEKMETDEPKSKQIYSNHLPLSVIQTGLKSGKYYQAKFQINRDNYLEGFVTIMLKNEAVNVLIQGRESINRAVHDDVVAIELAPESEWKSNLDFVVTAEIEEVEEEVEEEKEYNLKATCLEKFANKSSDQPKKPTGKVVGIIRRNWRQYCGVLQERDANITKSIILTSHFFIPVEKRIPRIKIETRQYENLKNQRIVVAIDSWPADSIYPKGHYVRALGPIGEKMTEKEVLLLEHDVPHLQFSKSVLNCLPDPITWSIPEEEFKKRLDFREKFVCSVDPPGCTDIDDAFHCTDLGNQVYEIGVHIADVSHFVKPQTAIDLEAAHRGTTVYLVDNRIDMIPNVLSSNLCSLLEGQERLTFSVIWKIDCIKAEILETKFAKTIIKSKGALTYAEAQLRIDSKEMNDEVTLSLRRLNSLAKILRQKRLDKGALILANASEIKFVDVESETHDNVTQIESKQIRETNSMVEEFMLLANISVAQKVYEELPQLALLRCHPKPSHANFDLLIKSGKSKDFIIDVTDGKSLSKSLELAHDSQNLYLNLMLKMIATRCMTSAKYFCSGKSPNPEIDFPHFGLATPIYTHFTSPIRRYADLIVHRLLSHIIGDTNLDSSHVNPSKIQDICENINYRHRQAQYASRASVRLHTIIFIRNSKKLIEEGYILFLRKNALQLFIPRLAFEANYLFHPISDWQFDGTKDEVVHLPSSTIFRQFDPVMIELSLKNQNNQLCKGLEVIDVKLIKPKIE